MLPVFSSSIFVKKKNAFNMARQRSPLTVTASPCSFSKKNGSIMPLDQNSHQTVIRFVFCASNATILLIYISARIKMSFIWKDEFFPTKISIVYKSIQCCSSVYTTIFIRRKDKTSYLSNQTWAKCYHSQNKR